MTRSVDLLLTMKFNSVTSLALTILFLSIHLQAYNPVDHFTISCGTAGESFDGDRTWAGDTNSDSILLSHQDTTVSAKATRQFPFTDQIPYTSARLSRSKFSYSFSVSTGPKFVRLFFYPASYPSFPRTDASFTVQSNQFTLLNGFNTSLMADSENTKTIFREYMVYINEGERLNLSFTPSQINSYAFINGIEVLSMPSNLYYTSANDAGFKLVGSDILYGVRTNTALETHYRIKVGGQGISPRNDTGLLRNWAGRDEDYLDTENIKDNLPGDMDGKMNITVNPDYVAPKELYRTARDVSRNDLKWEFPVDSGFYYMIRLHFCELESNISDISERMFLIYIASKLAEERTDVMKWSQKQKGLAVYKDYAVLIPKNDMKKKVNLSLQMHPYESGRDAKYRGPLLNGLEIIKINDMPVQEGKDSRVGVVLWVVAGMFFVLYLLLSVSSKWHPLSFSTIESTNMQNSSLPSDHCRRFSIIQIKAATKNFDKVFIVGAGGFGHVYKGYIDGSSIPVAIKRLKLGSKQGAREFMNEIEMLRQLRHRHLVQLIGYCNDDNEKILVYDFMAGGVVK